MSSVDFAPRYGYHSSTMMGLWADGWFYISSAGLLVSGILFFFLLGQYRAASEAADVSEAEIGTEREPASSSAIRPVYIPDEPADARIVSHPPHEPEAKPVAQASDVKVEPKPENEYAGPERRRETTTATGGISPAVVYLQNIKGELAELHQEMRALAKRVEDELSAVSTRDEALIDRLGELARAVESMKGTDSSSSAEAPVAASAPKKARKAEKAPDAEPVTVQPAVELVLEVQTPPVEVPPPPEPAPVSSPDATIRVEPGAVVATPPIPQETQAPATEPAPTQAEPPPEDKPRRGPVWPV